MKCRPVYGSAWGMYECVEKVHEYCGCGESQNATDASHTASRIATESSQEKARKCPSQRDDDGQSLVC